jgi:hypothetical protein
VANHAISVGTAHVNLSPTLFHVYARQYLDCERSYQAAPDNSPVPYFLICRAIELELKAKHLESKSRAEVKKQFGHNLKKSYDSLPSPLQTLDAVEYTELCRASEIYDIPNKGFEYVSVGHAVTQLKHFPDLGILKKVAIKLVGT